tara:strand:- start:2372 stop:2485 length:114 start_codon:yes stop_codon:yes gene_type:complete
MEIFTLLLINGKFYMLIVNSYMCLQELRELKLSFVEL